MRLGRVILLPRNLLTVVLCGTACGGIAVETSSDDSSSIDSTNADDSLGESSGEPDDVLIIAEDDIPPPFPERLRGCDGSGRFMSGARYSCVANHSCGDGASYTIECDNGRGEVQCSCSMNGKVLSEFLVQISWGENACEYLATPCFDF